MHPYNCYTLRQHHLYIINLLTNNDNTLRLIKLIITVKQYQTRSNSSQVLITDQNNNKILSRQLKIHKLGNYHPFLQRDRQPVIP